MYFSFLEICFCGLNYPIWRFNRFGFMLASIRRISDFLPDTKDLFSFFYISRFRPLEVNTLSNDISPYAPLFFAFGIVVAGLIIGFILEKLILWFVTKILTKTRRQERAIVVKSFNRVIVFWITLMSLYIAIMTFPRDTSSFNEVIWGILLVILVFSLIIVVARITGGIIAFYGRRSRLPQSVSIYSMRKTPKT
ncbi:MAG: hypothetical protein ACFFGZ_11025 [Candidatus Thorarchaeota archaeon]